MALKGLEVIRRAAWALVAIALLAPASAPAQTCDPELLAVALVFEAAPPSPSASHPCCAVSGPVAAAQGQRAGTCAGAACTACQRGQSDFSQATRSLSPVFSAPRLARYCARTARLLR